MLMEIVKPELTGLKCTPPIHRPYVDIGYWIGECRREIPMLSVGYCNAH